MIFLLLIIEILLTFFAFRIHKQDIMTPSVIVCLFYFGSSLLAALNYNRYEMMNFHENTTFIISGSLFLFVVVSYLAKQFFFRVGNRIDSTNVQHDYQDNACIFPNKLIFFIVIVIQMAGIVYQYLWVRSIMGGGIWSEVMFQFRNTNSSYSLDAVTRPSLLANIQTFSQISAYIYGYVFAYNFPRLKSINHRIMSQLIWFIPTVLYTAMIFMNAGRGAALEVIMQLFVLVYIMIQKYKHWSSKYSYKFFGRLIGGVVLILIAFSASRFIVGRANTLNTFQYISQYAGAAVKNLDLYLQESRTPPSIWGEETFGAIHNQLAGSWGHPEWKYIRHLEFRHVNGIGLGNVYGAIRYYYYDFGILGVILIVSMCSAVLTYLYYSLKKIKRKADRFEWNTFIYAYLSYTVFMFPIAEWFANLIVTRANIKMLLWLWIMKSVVIEKKIMNKRIVFHRR